MAEGDGKGGTQIGVGKLGSDAAIRPEPPAPEPPEPVTKLSDPAINATLLGPAVSDPAIKPTMLPESGASAGTTARAPLDGRVETLAIVDKGYYDVQGEFGRGGLGRVLRARDRRTGRIVAVKEALRATPGLLARFAREAIVTANLQHPAIIPVYEVGRWITGEPFYAMKLVAGRSLAEAAKQATTLRERIALLSHLIAVADALAYAHGERVIHRDLKPANVLIGDYGETVVIDWGLAKRLGDAEDLVEPTAAADGKTIAGSVMGTPGYMPPEQARGEIVDERADVYSIGAMLYEVLSGKRPFADTTSIDEVLRLAAEAPPPPLREIDAEIPAELIAIVERAMAFDKAKRYRDAKALSEDLRRFQTGQLVGAHEYTTWQLVRRWVRRHAAVVTAAAIGVVALAVVGGYSFVRIRASRDRAIAAQQRAVESQHAALSAQGLAEDRAAALAEEQGRQLTVSGDPARGLPYLASAVDGGRRGPGLAFVIARALDSMSRVEAVLSASTAPLDMVSYSPDGNRLVTSGFDGVVRLWDAHAHRAIKDLGKGSVARWMPDGAIAVIVPDGSHVELRDPDAGAVTALPGTLPEPSVAIAIAKARVAVGGANGALTWWADGVPHTVAKAHAKKLVELAFSPDGTRLASASEDAHITVWRVADGTQLATMTMEGALRSLAWSPDGTRLAGGSYESTVAVFDAATGTALAHMKGHKDSVESVRFDRSGKRVLSGSRDNTAIVWDATTGKPLATLAVANHIVEAQWSPDDHLIATRDEHGDITLFTGEGMFAALLAGHTGSLSEVAFSPSGPQLASVGLDGDLRLWHLDPTPALVTLAPPPAAMWRGAFSADGKLAAVTNDDGIVRVYTVATGVLAYELTGHTKKINTVAFSSDGHIVTAGEDGTFRIYQGATQRFASPPGPRVRSAAYSPDGSRIATTHGDGTTHVWTAAGEPMFTLKPEHGEPRIPLWSPDGTRLLVTLDHAGAALYAADGKLLGTANAPVEFVTAAGWMHDGTSFGIGTTTSRLIFTFDGTTAKPLAQLEGHTLGPIWTIDDTGGALLTSSGDGTARLWQAGKTRLAIGDGTSSVMAAAYRPDGALVALGNADGIASIWDTTTGKEVGRTLIAADVPITQLTWSPDGQSLLIMTMSAGARLWRVPAWSGTVPELAARLRCALHWKLDGATLAPASPDPAACR
ncbi:MAG: protein kinase [Deltaproteobacteria bacterium]|nr:protein kinase [Deltaproteobacteria bacterium]